MSLTEQLIKYAPTKKEKRIMKIIAFIIAIGIVSFSFYIDHQNVITAINVT